MDAPGVGVGHRQGSAVKRVWRVSAIAVLLALAAAGVLVYRPAIRAVATPTAASFAAADIARGAALARIGDCAVCHTARGAAPYAGGRPVPTPFGVIYGTNITPDPQTGIGRWSLAAFDRALRQGVRRDGAHLYPAMPYDHFAGLSDGDVRALYAFLMTRRPVSATAPANHLVPPLGLRPVVEGWKLLFFKPASPSAGRGPYLVDALAHCGACHTPHNALGAEQRDHALAGGWAEGWYAPALDASSPAAGAWTADRLYAYLRTGLDADHAAAAGPMGPVADELGQAPEADVRAVAAAVAAGMQGARAPAAPPTLDRSEAAAKAYPQGAALFAGACAACHGPGAPMMLDGRPGLERGSPLWEENPRDTLQIMLQGLSLPTPRAGPSMPAFADTFTDAQLAEIAAYARTRYSIRPPWPDLAKAARAARKAGGGQ
jgi:mono/diheme cytochrome c family protein